jgi:hypothetical protein
MGMAFFAARGWWMGGPAQGQCTSGPAESSRPGDCASSCGRSLSARQCWRSRASCSALMARKSCCGGSRTESTGASAPLVHSRIGPMVPLMVLTMAGVVVANSRGRFLVLLGLVGCAEPMALSRWRQSALANVLVLASGGGGSRAGSRAQRPCAHVPVQ